MKNKNMQVLHSSPKTRRTPPAAGFATGLCFYKLLWIFLVGCVIGCLVEMLWCYLNEGFFESRQGLIYGPFSPVYGLGAVLFTLVMYRFKHSSSFIIFLVSAAVGALFEYVCSWVQEMAFGTVSWEYSNEPLNLNGRTSLSFAVMWGVLGLVFMKHVLPFFRAAYRTFAGKGWYYNHLDSDRTDGPRYRHLRRCGAPANRPAQRRAIHQHYHGISRQSLSRFLFKANLSQHGTAGQRLKPYQKVRQELFSEKRRGFSRRFFESFCLFYLSCLLQSIY